MLLGIIFLNTELSKPHFLLKEMFYTLFATNEAKHILDRHFSYSCNDTINSKSLKKNLKQNPIFESNHFSISQYCPNAKVLFVQAVIA